MPENVLPTVRDVLSSVRDAIQSSKTKYKRTLLFLESLFPADQERGEFATESSDFQCTTTQETKFEQEELLITKSLTKPALLQQHHAAVLKSKRVLRSLFRLGATGWWWFGTSRMSYRTVYTGSFKKERGSVKKEYVCAVRVLPPRRGVYYFGG